MAFKFTSEMLAGLYSLHTFSPTPIYHRDLKSLNILVTEDWTVKITDFGLARFNTDDNIMKSFVNPVGTIGFSAPEVLSGSGFTDKADIWSMAMVLYEVFYRAINGEYKRPYEEYGLMAEYLVVAKVVESNLTPTIPTPSPDDLQNIFRICWNKVPEKRPSIMELQQKIEQIQNRFMQDTTAWKQQYTSKQ